LAGPDRAAARWRWYASKTSDCVPLDRDAYPTTIYDGRPIPWPDWACKAPDGGVHTSASVGSIDVHVSEAPSGQDEVTWTCNFSVRVVSRGWLAAIEDLIDGKKICLGRLYLNGEELADWATLHEVRSPALIASEGRAKTCHTCGSHYTTLHGRVSFTDPTVLDRPLIIAGSDIFIREDEVIRRNLRTPSGSFKPSLIRFESPSD
jgi:hypothetical protein